MTEQHTAEVPRRKTRAGKRPTLRDVKFEREYTGWLLERLEAARGDCIHALYLVSARLDTPLAEAQPFKFTEQDLRELSDELRVSLMGLRTARHLVKAHMLDVAQLIEELEAKRSGKRSRAGQDAAEDGSATHREGVSG